MTADEGQVTVVRVLPDVSGLDRAFDYLVPTAWPARVVVGDQVRVPLHGRRVRGWVVDTDLASPAVADDRLVPLVARLSHGPAPEVVELARWAAWRWGSARVRGLLSTASPPRDVPSLGPSRRTTVRTAPRPGIELHRVGPLTDPIDLVLEAATAGPTIALHPSPAGARALGRRLARAGLSVATMPDDWASAAAGVDVVVGARSAVWAPCPGLAAVVVLDEHDEALQEERSPTWHARDVAIERGARAGAQVVLVSPVPTSTARHLASHVTSVSVDERRRGWPRVDIVDRSSVAPWQRVSLLGSEVIAALRGPGRVACVHNVPGRSRLLACRSCHGVLRCEACDAAVAMSDDGRLTCARCATSRPPVCQVCGSSALANVRPGVARLREEIEAAAGRAAGVVTAATSSVPDVDVFVGTEAVLHRVRDLDVVAFLDLDHELFAPRYRSTEHTLSMLVRAARLVGGNRPGAELIVQTYDPAHPLLAAVAAADPSLLDDDDDRRRRELRLPPFAALAALSGPGAGAMARATGLDSSIGIDDALIRADDWTQLADALAGSMSAARAVATGAARAVSTGAARAVVRVEVDPPRR